MGDFGARVRVEQIRQSMRFSVLEARTVTLGKTESIREKGSLGLTGVEPFGGPDQGFCGLSK